MCQVQHLPHPPRIGNDRPIHMPQHRSFSHRSLTQPILGKGIVSRTALKNNRNISFQLMECRLYSAIADFLLTGQTGADRIAVSGRINLVQRF